MDNDEQRLRDFVRDANKKVWEAYLLMNDQAFSNSLLIDVDEGISIGEKASKRSLKIKRFAEALHELNGQFCMEFKKEIYECACDNCARSPPTTKGRGYRRSPSHSNEGTSPRREE